MRREWCALSVEASHGADAVRLVSMATSTSAQEGQGSTVDSECHFSIYSYFLHVLSLSS